MFNDLTGLGYGLVIFAVIIGVGTLITFNFGGTVGNCGIAACGSAGVFNRSTGVCSNANRRKMATTTVACFLNLSPLSVLRRMQRSYYVLVFSLVYEFPC